MMRLGLPTTATRSSEAYWAPRGYCQVRSGDFTGRDNSSHPVLRPGRHPMGPSPEHKKSEQFLLQHEFPSRGHHERVGGG